MHRIYVTCYCGTDTAGEGGRDGGGMASSKFQISCGQAAGTIPLSIDPLHTPYHPPPISLSLKYTLYSAAFQKKKWFD